MLHLSRVPPPPPAAAPQVQGREPQGQEPLGGAGVLRIPSTSPVPAAPACPGVKGRALIEPPRQSLRTGLLWGPAAPARPVLFAPLGGEALIPGPPHTPRPRASPAGLCPWPCGGDRDTESWRGPGVWEAGPSGASGPSPPGDYLPVCGGAQGQAAAVGVGGRARKTDAGLQQGEPPLALGSQGASTPRLPTTGLCVWPPLPRRNSK